jgi:hypothetical protein
MRPPKSKSPRYWTEIFSIRWDHHPARLSYSPALILATAATDLLRGGLEQFQARIVTRPRISRRLVQCESVQRDDFFPGQLIGGAPAHDRPHIALLDELATLRPICRPCANLAHRLRSANYSGRRPGYGCGASAVSTTLPCLRGRCHPMGARCFQREAAHWCTLHQLRFQRRYPSASRLGGHHIGFYPFPAACLY